MDDLRTRAFLGVARRILWQQRESAGTVEKSPAEERIDARLAGTPELSLEEAEAGVRGAN